MARTTNELVSITDVAQWKMRRDFELSTMATDALWVQGWMEKLRHVVIVEGRRPEEVSIEPGAVSDPINKGRPSEQLTVACSQFTSLVSTSLNRELRIGCEAAQLGAIATLLSLAKEHSLNLEVTADHPTGKALTRSLMPDGSQRFDFIIATVAPTILEASSDFARHYQVLRIPHKEELLFLRKRDDKNTLTQRDVTTERLRRTIKSLPIYVVRNTSGHASVLGGSHPLRYLDEGHQLINCAITLPENAWIAVWEPIASWLLSKDKYRLEPIGETDLHPIALYSSRNFEENKTSQELRKQFNDIFWLQWSQLLGNPDSGWNYLLHNIPEGFRKQFGDFFNRQEFTDYDQYATCKYRVLSQPHEVERSKAVHNEDYTMVNWFGTEYTFALGVQSQVVEVLWKEWENTGLGLHQQTIRNHVDAEKDNFKITTAFRGHPAMRKMIQKRGDGRYQLCEPDADGKERKTFSKKS